MSRKHWGRFQGEPVTYQIPSPAGGVRLETFVPWTLVKRGVRQQIITPLDAPQAFQHEAQRERQLRQRVPNTPLLRALGLAHHWQRLLDEGRMASVSEIAQAEGIDPTQVRRLLRLTLLAPQMIEQLLRSPNRALEQVLRRPWHSGWDAQMRGHDAGAAPDPAGADPADHPT